MTEDDDLPFRDDVEASVASERPVEGDRADRGDRDRDQDKRRLFERVMPEILKRVVERAVESGASRLAEGPENLRHFVQEMKLPKEALHYLYQQIDDTKNGLYRVVAKEIRDVLDQTQLSDEITKVLTKLSFEIKTEIRFIPNDAGTSARRAAEDEDAPPGGRKLPKPEVTAQVSVKDRGRRFPSTRPPAPSASSSRGSDASNAPNAAPQGAPPQGPFPNGRRREDT